MNQQSHFKLNKEQQEAVNYTTGPLLVIAGAGSGKTRVITQKIAHLIKNCGYQANTITAITFTNKAAKEMLERTKKSLIDLNTRGLTICTFHSLGLKILKKECSHLGYKPTFSILDSYDSGKIISDLAKTTDRSLIRSLQHKISIWKNALLSPEALLTKFDEANQVTSEVNIASSNRNSTSQSNASINSFYTIEDVQIYRNYQDTLKTYHAVDFDDLIKLPMDLLNSNPEVLFKWQQKIGYLLIDEYQDTNHCQYQLIKLLAGRYGLFTAVGDDDQSIYAWRGANPNNLSILQQDFKKLKVIKLEQNYRSTTTILTAANSVINNNNKLFEKNLWSKFAQGEAINIIAAKNDETEADTIARKITLHQMQYQSKLSDYAILYRSNHQARLLEQALRNYQLTYAISGGQSFFEKSEIKDIISYLRLIVNDDDDTAFTRAITTPKRGVGNTTLEKLATYANNRNISLFAALFEEGFAHNCNSTQLTELITFGNFINNLQFRSNKEPANELINSLLVSINYEQYLYDNNNVKTAEKMFGNVLSFVNWIGKKSEEQGKTLPEIVQTISLITMLENNNEDSIDAIKLTTLHAAKGLEYNYVYLISCEEGIIPHQESINNQTIEEERRLMYVGITRAKKELTISYCKTRKQNGELQTREPSRFLEEMGADNIINHATGQNQKSTLTDTKLQDRLAMLKKLIQTD